MASRHCAGPDRLRAHAWRVDLLRSRLGQVRIAGHRIGRQQAAFGALCGWILTGLGDRYIRHDKLLVFIEENLRLAVRGLHGVASGQQRFANFVDVPDPDAPREDQPRLFDESPLKAGEFIDAVVDIVGRREWVDPRLAEAAPVAEFAAPVSPTYTALRACGLDCSLASVQPLRRLLDDLTGAPDMVAIQVGCWTTMATDLRSVGVDLWHCLDRDFAGAGQLEVRAYLAMMASNVEALMGLAGTADALALINRSAGDLILLTRDIIRGLIGDLFARVIIWVADTTTVVSRSEMLARLTIVGATAWRVHDYTRALVASIVELSRALGDDSDPTT